MKTKNTYPKALKEWNDYRSLIAKVRKIDKEAADWLKNEAKKWFEEKVLPFNPDNYLPNVFVFSQTPQGHDYWWRLHEAVRGY